MNIQPDAEVYAIIKGNENYPELQGKITFTEVYAGTLVTVFVKGLPENDRGNFYGFHIHEGNSCTGDRGDSFRAAGSHFNPKRTAHPFHAGDMPVLMGNQGMAWMTFYTDRFYPEEIIGRTVIIHDMADDFISQPSGNAGVKIGCGVVTILNE